MTPCAMFVWNRATKHGWRSTGFCRIGNGYYAELSHRGRYGFLQRICIQPTTGRIFAPCMATYEDPEAFHKWERMDNKST